MSSPPTQPERVTVDGKNYFLKTCTDCTGTVQIYFVNKETDRTKKAIWEVHNKDGSIHQHNKAKSSGGGGWRPPALKFSVSASQPIGNKTVTLSAEFLKSDTTFDKAYEEVCAKLDSWVKKV